MARMSIQQTATGWVAVSEGLAGRGATREEAVRNLDRIVALVRRLAAQGNMKPNASTSEPRLRSERSPRDAQE